LLERNVFWSKSVEENETFPVYSHFSCVIGFDIITPTGRTCQNCYAVTTVAELLTVIFAVGSYEVSKWYLTENGCSLFLQGNYIMEDYINCFDQYNWSSSSSSLFQNEQRSLRKHTFKIL